MRNRLLPSVFCLFFFSISFLSVAQNREPFTKSADSDPQAKEILGKLRQKYDALKTLQADFTLEIELAEQPKEIQQGAILREGEKYRLDMAGQTVVCDGKAVYLILHNNKEVQINNLPEEGDDQGILSPQGLFNLYESDKFVYALTDEVARGGTIVQQIEFKPLDPYADYSKLRMEIDKKKNDVMQVLAFGKDGSRYTFKLTRLVANAAIDAAQFVFDKGKYPDYYVEDLRY